MMEAQIPLVVVFARGALAEAPFYAAGFGCILRRAIATGHRWQYAISSLSDPSAPAINAMQSASASTFPDSMRLMADWL